MTEPPARTLTVVTRADGFTDADVSANVETIAANVRRLVVERAAAAGLAPADYVANVLIPRYKAAGMSDDGIEAFLALLKGTE